MIAVSSFIIGIYDGFYGLGTGTFLQLAFTKLGRMGHFAGAKMVLNSGIKIIKPVILVVLVIMAVKIAAGV